MICLPEYDSYEAIPEQFRPEFEESGDKWKLKSSAIPGVGELFNDGLVSNMRKAISQAKSRKAKIDELEGMLGSLTSELEAERGAQQHLSQDSETLKKYTAFGTPGEVQSQLAELETLRGLKKELDVHKTMSEFDYLNADVLMDWVKQEPGLEFFTKVVEETNGSGKKAVSKPFVRFETTSNGKATLVEKDLLDYAKEQLPAWKVEALLKKEKEKAVAVSMPDFRTQTIRVPSTDTKPVDTFNSRRNGVQNPFMPSKKGD